MARSLLVRLLTSVILAESVLTACQLPPTVYVQPDVLSTVHSDRPTGAILDGDQEDVYGVVSESTPDLVTLEGASREFVPIGELILSDSAGLSSYSLEMQEQHSLVTFPEDAIGVANAVSPDRKRAAYAIMSADHHVLVWLTDTHEWQPQLIHEVTLTQKESESPIIRVSWVSNRYVAVDIFANWFDGVPIRSILLDANDLDVENDQVGSLFVTCELAVSPRTDKIATWCPVNEHYLVIDADDSIWEALQPPNLDDSLFMIADQVLWVWSGNGRRIAFPLVGGGGLTQRWITALGEDVTGENPPTPSPFRDLNWIVITDQNAEAFDRIGTVSSTPALSLGQESWSPDNRFLAFIDECDETAPRCVKIADVENEEVLWASSEVVDFGAYDGIVWAPDSEHIALKTRGDKLLIVNVLTGMVVWQADDVSGNLLAWIQ